MLSIFLGLSTLAAHCQYFTDLGFSIGLDVHVFDNLHGAGVSFVDFNQDGCDDLTFCEDGVVKFYINAEGQAQLQDLGITAQENAKHPIWVDFDNDGDLDFFLTQKDFPNRLFECGSDGSFTDITVQAGLPLYDDPSYGASWADYDNDGDLDVYVSNYVYLYSGDDEYHYYNHLYQNNGDGTFSDVTIQSDVSDGVSLSFQSVWFDADQDGFDDLFVINDLEHPNRFYHNNGDGTFEDLSETSGLDLPIMDAMSASVGDFNNDGLFDLFITNVAIQSCALMINNGDLTFANIANTSGTTINQLCWGALWLDYDYDRDQDLYVCENHYAFPDQHNPLLRNEGDNTFTNIGASNLLFDQTNSYCCAKGDWNQDGFIDIAVNNWEWNNASLWQNSGAAYNPVLVSLEGVYSNRMGAGARVSSWADGVVDKRVHLIGENYMGQNSLMHRFGTGGFSQLDSLVVEWPSGLKDRITNVIPGEHYHMIEGENWSSGLSIPSELKVCSNDSVSLEFPEAMDITWADGSTIDQTSLGAGSYQIVAHHPLGLTDTLAFTIEEVQILDVVTNVGHTSCAGAQDGFIELNLAAVDSVIWSDGSTEGMLDSLANGWYILHSFLDGCSNSDSLYVDEPESLEAESLYSDVLCFGDSTGTHFINGVSGGTSPYYFNGDEEITAFPSGSNNLTAGEHTLEISDAHGCLWSETISISQPLEIQLIGQLNCENGLSVDLTVSGGTSPYAFDWSDGSSDEDVYESPEMCVAVLVSDFNQCNVQSDAWCCTTSMNEVDSQQWTLSQIPGSRTVSINHFGNTSARVILMDVSGRKIDEGKISPLGQLQFTVPSAGVYVVGLATGGRLFTRRIAITP